MFKNDGSFTDMGMFVVKACQELKIPLPHQDHTTEESEGGPEGSVTFAWDVTPDKDNEDFVIIYSFCYTWEHAALTKWEPEAGPAKLLKEWRWKVAS